VVIGDLDSISESFMAAYTSSEENNENNVNIDASSHDEETVERRRTDNIKLIRDPNQNNTDLDKALIYLTSKLEEDEYGNQSPLASDDHAICVLGGLGGNLSQILGNINTLYLFSHLKIYLLSNDNISILLRKGKNRIRLREGMYCSIIPFTSSPFSATNGVGDLKYPLGTFHFLNNNLHHIS
jgi:thiamine pyrophosphokinase